jgi:hypothetical protein
MNPQAKQEADGYSYMLNEQLHYEKGLKDCRDLIAKQLEGKKQSREDFMKENGLGEEDMKNDITYPRT